MIAQETPLLLGSASPRRRELLSGLGIPLHVLPADVNEDVLANEQPLAYLERIAADKLRAVQARAEGLAFGAMVVADTSVVLGQQILGKPTDVADAERLLKLLSGVEHIVYTRYAFAGGSAGASVVGARTVSTRVRLRAADEAVLRRYAQTGEGLDKAGAYAAQGIGAFLVERIDGSYSNVVGLPLCELVQDLVQAGLLAQFP